MLPGDRARPSAFARILPLVQQRASPFGHRFHDPAAVHFGTAPALWQQRAKVLQAAYAAHPERFKGKIPTPPDLPTIVGINLPKTLIPETANDLITTPSLLTNFQTQVSHSH